MLSPTAAHAIGLLGLANIGLSATLPRAKTGLSFTVPARVPADASKIVDPDFLGLAFEESSFVRYSTDDTGGPNVFSQNLMDSIYSRTGGKPIIRLGGTSQDYAKYIPGQPEPALPVAEQNNYQDVGGTTIGPSYWTHTSNFPDATYMVQVPLANANVTATVEWAKAAVDGIGLDSIHSIQIGNEPNAYKNTYTGEGGIFLGPPKFQGTLTNETYTGNYTKYAKAIRDAIKLPNPFFTAFDVGAEVNTPYVAAYLLDVETNFNLGIDDGNILKEVAHHYYQNQAGGAADLATGLMTMKLTHTNLDYSKKHITYLKENKPHIDYIFNEIGNSLDPTNSYAYQAVLGSALWAVDFYLYALSIGVARFNYQQIMHSGFDMWLPVASSGFPAQVFPNYYSHVFLADFVGTSGKTRVSKVDITNGDSAPNLAAYAAFEAGTPKRIAVANLDYWNKTSSGTTRPHATIDIKVPSKCGSLRVTRLNSPDGAGAGADSITYAGSQWSYESLGKEATGVRHDTTLVSISKGVATVKVPSSEAVIIELNPR